METKKISLKRRITIIGALLGLLLASCLVFASATPVAAADFTVTVTLLDHTGDGLEGGLVTYRSSGGGSDITIGTTDPDGVVTGLIPDWVTKVKMTWEYRSEVKDLVGGAATFNTALAQVYFKTCVGDSPIPNVVIQWKPKDNFWTFGTTDANGLTEKEVLTGGGTYDLQINNYQMARSAVVDDWDFVNDGAYTFRTTKVAISYPGAIQYKHPAYTGAWHAYTNPMEMLPGNYTFKFDSTEVPLTISGCEVSGQFGVIRLLDHNGKGLPNGVATYRSKGGGYDITIGTTGPDGVVMGLIPDWVTKVKMTWEYRSEVKDLVGGAATFNTALAQVYFKTCVGDSPIPNVVIQWKPKDNFWTFGTTDANGLTEKEVLTGGGTYDLQINNYQMARSAVVDDWDFVNDGAYTFRTTKVAISYPGAIQYKHPAYTGAWHAYTNPMEMLPGNYTFRFKTGPGNNDWSAGTPITISACSMEGCIKIVYLKDSNGKLITNSNATIVYQPNSSGNYIPFGSGALDASGSVAALVPCGTHRYHLTYLGATQEKQTSSATVTYQTQLVTVELRDSGNNLIKPNNATIVWQPGSAGSYVQFGTNNDALQANGCTSMEVLPLSNRYHLTYLGATQEKQTSSATVTYQTQLVTVELRDSGNNLIKPNNATIVWQPGSAGSYVQFGTNNDALQANGCTSMEVLPLSNRYRMTYVTTKEKQSSSATVTYYSSDF